MRFGRFAFGTIEVDGTAYDHDVVIDRGRVRKRKKGPQPLRSRYGLAPLSVAETCRGSAVGSSSAAAPP